MDRLQFPAACKIAELCLEKFKGLPKTGKPTSKEWTVLAGVVLHDASTNRSKAVALGAGTKCIGRDKLCGSGLILNDSHAEVLARRALLRFIYQELRKATENNVNTIFEWNEDRLYFSLKPNLSFHFLSTQTPCGDACIAEERCPEGDEIGVPTKKSKLDNTVGKEEKGDMGQLLPINSELVYTGAKLIGAQHQDVMQQTLGAVRTKPGRGERTLSMTCSDKLSKWNVLGVQGALLDVLLNQPIYFSTLNFCCVCKQESLERAIYNRWRVRQFENDRYKPQLPEVRICGADICFVYAQAAEKQPSPTGLVWCDIPAKLKPYEISVNGKRQGITAKQLHTPRAALKISKYELLKEFIDLLHLKPKFLQKLGTNTTKLRHMTYAQCKQLATNYQVAWSLAKSAYFLQWTQKPTELLAFSIDKVEFSARA